MIWWQPLTQLCHARKVEKVHHPKISRDPTLLCGSEGRQQVGHRNPVMSALLKCTHFDIADACRDIPESTRKNYSIRVMARGNDGQTIFPTESDYEADGDQRDFEIEMLKQLMATVRCRRVDKGAL